MNPDPPRVYRTKEEQDAAIERGEHLVPITESLAAIAESGRKVKRASKDAARLAELRRRRSLNVRKEIPYQ